MVNKDRIQGKARDLGGTVEENVGAATGEEELEARGVANRAQGKAQDSVGKVKDAAKDMKDAVTGH